MNEILDIIGKLIGVAFFTVVAMLVPKAKTWLTMKIGETRTNNMFKIINGFCEAAEQLYRDDDPTGEIRNNYVKCELEKLGIIITGEVDSMIESCVFEINKAEAELGTE